MNAQLLTAAYLLSRTKSEANMTALWIVMHRLSREEFAHLISYERTGSFIKEALQ